MKSLLENVKEIDLIIRQLNKMASRIRAGQTVDAYRECNRLSAHMEQHKQTIIKERQDKVEDVK